MLWRLYWGEISDVKPELWLLAAENDDDDGSLGMMELLLNRKASRGMHAPPPRAAVPLNRRKLCFSQSFFHVRSSLSRLCHCLDTCEALARVLGSSMKERTFGSVSMGGFFFFFFYGKRKEKIGWISYSETKLIGQRLERVFLQSGRDVIQHKTQLLRVAEVQDFG